jgi:hypothetical protein
MATTSALPAPLFDDHLHRAGLNQVKGVAVIALTKIVAPVLKVISSILPMHLGDILARQCGEDRNAADEVGLGFHG